MSATESGRLAKLAALVVAGTVDAQEACRKAYDRDGLRATLQREGVDSATLERLG